MGDQNETQVSATNPWTVTAVNAFSFFCCPQCDYKSKAVPPFMNHAAKNHPDAREFCDSHDDLLKKEIKYEATELDMKEHLTFGENQINSDNFVQHLNNQGENQDTDFFEDIIDYQDFEEPTPAAKRKKRKRKIKEVKEIKEEPDSEDFVSCSACNIRLPTLVDLSEHNLTEHQEDKESYICPVCHHITKGGKKGIRDHIRRKHETSRVSCPECNRTIKEDTLMAHMEATHSSKKGKGHKCTDCSFESNNRTSLSNHIKYMHPSDTTQHPYACDKCAKTFPYASGLQQHFDKVHLKLKSYVCEKCGKGFNSKIEFIEHQALPSCNFMTSTDIIFNCDKCQDTFNTVKGYIRHHEVLHGHFPANLNTGPVHLCDECPKIYLKQRTLELHKKRVHRGTLTKQHSRKTYECPTCKKIFTSGNNLDEHIKVKHENNTPEQCDECNRAFGTPHALKAHKYNMHKRSKCEICGQSLCNTFWLKRHMSASHGIMPEGSIPCTHCPLFFSSKGAKDNHVKKQHADLFKV